MTPSELLAATGNVWQVRCYKDGNKRICLGDKFVRAENREQAIRIAKEVCRGAKHCVAWPWDPAKDLSVRGFVVSTN